MNTLEKAIAALFPGWAYSRVRARYNIQAYERAYEAAKPSRLRKIRNDRGSGDAATQAAGDSLRIQARHLDQNHDLARSVLDTLVNRVVGLGIRPEPTVKDQNGELVRKFNRDLLELYRDWSKRPEVTWEYHFNHAQRMAARTWFRDGEMLAQRLGGSIATLDHGTRVPYSIELMEPDLLPIELDDEKKGIIQGVEKNKWGRPRAYHLLKEHPGDPTSTFTFKTDTKRVKADNIIHLKFIDRIKQTRGVSVFAAVMTRLDDLKDYEESERVAARVAAAMCAFIRKSLDGPAGGQDTDDLIGKRKMKMVPGMIFDTLLPGEEIGTIESKRPNAALEPFRNGQLKAVAGGTGTNYSSIAKDYNGTYSAQRQELVEQSVHYEVLRDHFIERFVRPIWEDFVTFALTAGLIEPPASVNKNSLLDADFRGPSLPWIDPVKEITAEEKAVQAGFKSRSQVIREHGRNPDDVFEQIKREREEENEAGITFTSNPANNTTPANDNTTQNESEIPSEENDNNTDGEDPPSNDEVTDNE